MADLRRDDVAAKNARPKLLKNVKNGPAEKTGNDSQIASNRAHLPCLLYRAKIYGGFLFRFFLCGLSCGGKGEILVFVGNIHMVLVSGLPGHSSTRIRTPKVWWTLGGPPREAPSSARGQKGDPPWGNPQSPSRQWGSGPKTGVFSSKSVRKAQILGLFYNCFGPKRQLTWKLDFRMKNPIGRKIRWRISQLLNLSILPEGPF